MAWKDSVRYLKEEDYLVCLSLYKLIKKLQSCKFGGCI